MRFADEAVIVTNPEVSSVRDSDRIIGLLDSTTKKAENGEQVAKHLLIARFDPTRVASGEMLNISDVLYILSIPLIGVIPESDEILRASNIGAPITICGYHSAASRAYFEVARRLSGEAVSVSIPSHKKGLLAKLFGRRAA
jgi:septum site-determining protein MinD